MLSKNSGSGLFYVWVALLIKINIEVEKKNISFY